MDNSDAANIASAAADEPTIPNETQQPSTPSETQQLIFLVQQQMQQMQIANQKMLAITEENMKLKYDLWATRELNSKVGEKQGPSQTKKPGV